ncbi:MAG: hypothetical protein IT210_00285 [Armatimonadetes bacterium]|nr:hypothetical protein [Armatimonadota bacterium]
MLRWLCLLLMAAPSCSGDAMDRALSAVGLARSTACFDAGDMANFGGGEFQLPLFKALHGDPYKISGYIPVLRDQAAAAAPSLHQMVTQGTLRVGMGLRRGWLDDPLQEAAKASEAPDALYQAIAAIHARYGKPIGHRQEVTLRARLSSVPPGMAKTAAYMLRSIYQALAWREKAFARAEKAFPGKDLYKMVAAWGMKDELSSDTYELLHLADLPYLFAGAEDLALAADRAADMLLKLTASESFPAFAWETPLGQIALNDARSHTYTVGKLVKPYLLILDTGGDDRYEGGGASTGWNHPASVVIDKSGDDHYIDPESEQPAFGGGVCGYGFLVDMAGDDRYDAVNLSQGAGFLGVGGLLDRAGEDFYTAYTASQGSGRFGIGFLSDLEGSDRYNAFQSSQGFGGTMGCGLLVDLTGNDVYTANDTRIAFPSAQTKEHNASLSQGVGCGLRADITDGHSLAGGVGMLVDGSGDDRYSAGLFAQGAGYWYGLGILADGKGNDIYNGIWYVQASAAHFAVGILHDGEGNDAYKAAMNMAIGAGHDFSTGFLMEESGNDRYDAPSLSLGGANANGIGLFRDRSGDDIYNVTGGLSLGQANAVEKGSLRMHMLCLGVFLDTGGKDSYTRPTARDNTLWTFPPADAPQGMEKGVGLDGEEER